MKLNRSIPSLIVLSALAGFPSTAQAGKKYLCLDPNIGFGNVTIRSAEEGPCPPSLYGSPPAWSGFGTPPPPPPVPIQIAFYDAASTEAEGKAVDEKLTAQDSLLAGKLASYEKAQAADAEMLRAAIRSAVGDIPAQILAGSVVLEIKKQLKADLDRLRSECAR